MLQHVVMFSAMFGKQTVEVSPPSSDRPTKRAMGGSQSTARATAARSLDIEVVSRLDSSTMVPGQRKLIGTHDGTFHCDEALACAMLRHLPEYEDAAVVRTRDPQLLGKCDIVVDVGGIYDHAALRYDHHQREFQEVMHECGSEIKLSSAGLVYRHYGKRVIPRIISSYTPDGHDAPNLDLSVAFRKVHSSFVEHIDAIDNGVEAFDGERKYKITTHLSGRVADMNPRWNENTSDEFRNARFANAVHMCDHEFSSRVQDVAFTWWPARRIVHDALKGAAALDSSRRIIYLSPGVNVPMQEHIFELEAEMKMAGDSLVENAALFAIHETEKGQYKIQAVPVEENSFSSRRKLPETWRGLKADRLDEATGVEGGVFVHAEGWVGAHSTFKGALALAKLACCSEL